MSDLTPLLQPRSIAVVGATSRPGAYGDETLRNLKRLGFPGRVWGVHPTRRRVHGRTCVPTLADLPEPVDAVVVAIPAAGVPDVIEQAGARGCGGAVVYGAGFGETPDGTRLQAALRAAAARHDLPVCGPNCDGIVALHDRAALWGDALVPREAGHVAVISESGNVAVNALAARRGLRLHTVVSCGNQAVVDAGDWLHAVAQRDGVRSVALFLESDGDGARLCEALALCADAGIGVAVLKVGASSAGASAAAAHTGAVAGDHAAFRALVQEAGAAWAHDVHELLELAKVLAVRGARPRGDGGLAILTCSGGDSGLGADEAQRRGLALPALQPDTGERVRGLLPAAATIANPLDYTALVWGEVETLRDMIAAVGADPGIDHVLVFYDQPHGLEGPVGESWDAVRKGIRAGAAASAVPTLVASTLPELLDDEAAWELARADVAAVAGLRTALVCAAALRGAPGDAGRLRAIAAAAVGATGLPGRWLDEASAKALLAGAGIRVPPGRIARDEDDAADIFARLGRPVALKLVATEMRHKTEAGAVALGLENERNVRWAYRDLVRNGHEHAHVHADARVLVEAMAPPGVELLVSARRDAVVPVLTVGLGGVWTEAFGDVAVIPRPADAARVERALWSLRAAPLLAGTRTGAPVDVAAAAALAARAGALLLDQGLELLELNPVLVNARGAVAVDALVRTRAHEPHPEGRIAA
ncbi:MAG TPA: acetate--CoA ligase family protein [Solirubrobacteraceae bacterium]|nr:acetate--CoA ligase family protein [Solirubrobacteraceae bacterium]